MNEQKIQEFINSIKKTQIKYKSYGGESYNRSLVEEQGFSIFESMLRTFILENRDEKLGILEAKVFMYEQIISKSNFSPMIELKSEAVIDLNENN